MMVDTLWRRGARRERERANIEICILASATIASSMPNLPSTIYCLWILLQHLDPTHLPKDLGSGSSKSRPLMSGGNKAVFAPMVRASLTLPLRHVLK